MVTSPKINNYLHHHYLYAVVLHAVFSPLLARKDRKGKLTKWIRAVAISYQTKIEPYIDAICYTCNIHNVRMIALIKDNKMLMLMRNHPVSSEKKRPTFNWVGRLEVHAFIDIP